VDVLPKRRGLCHCKSQKGMSGGETWTAAPKGVCAIVLRSANEVRRMVRVEIIG